MLTTGKNNAREAWLPGLSFVYLPRWAVKHNIKIKVMSTLHSYTLLESIVYKLQEKGAIVDPCVVDDLITCIKTTKKVEYNKIKI